MGAKFWLAVCAVTVAGGLGCLILFLLIGWAWYAWGFLGMFLVFGGIALALAYVHDRRAQNRYDRLPA